MERVLVGTDGSAAATRGVAWASGLAGALGAELIVTAVLAPGLSGFDGTDADGGRARVAGLLDGPWSESARAGDVAVTTSLVDGDPRVALLDEVDARNADIIVLGSAGCGWFPAPHLGHVAHALAHHSPVPLVIVPRGAVAESSRGCILVGLDGSPDSAAAVAWTVMLAGALQRDVIAVHVHLRERTAEQRHDHADLERQCNEWAAPLRTAGIATRVVVAQGWPASAIVELEAIEAPSLVVLGARGAGGFRDLRLGSVGLGVLQHSTTPVAIVPSTTAR
jgi:nucleotide-binding universal stress UspA family protein